MLFELAEKVSENGAKIQNVILVSVMGKGAETLFRYSSRKELPVIALHQTHQRFAVQGIITESIREEGVSR